MGTNFENVVCEMATIDIGLNAFAAPDGLP